VAGCCGGVFGGLVMTRVVGALCALSVLISVGLLSGCTIDTYAFRAIQYNFEAEETQNQVILLNIVRSSLHRPMEFTEITNIVGANSASGTTSFSFPVGFRLPTGVTTGTAGGTLGGSTTFTIPVLDTQDFYEGLLGDIQPSLLAYYLQSPFVSEELLFNLFVERIVVHVNGSACMNRHTAACEDDFRNNPLHSEDIALFQTLANYLLNLEISAEPVQAQSKTQTIKANGATINISGASSATSSDSSGGGSTQATPYRLCFNPRVAGQGVPATAICGNAQPKGTSQQIAPSTKVSGVLFSRDLAREMLDEVIPAQDDEPKCPSGAPDPSGHDQFCFTQSIKAFAGHPVDITLEFRSTGSIFNFLGQLVETAEQSGRTYPLYPSAPFEQLADKLIPCWMTPNECKPIVLVRPSGVATLVSATYNASLYAVPGDPNISYSPDVFTILKQLVALNLSGKNLPTTAILSLTSTTGP
jgi:hypothetical protein